MYFCNEQKITDMRKYIFLFVLCCVSTIYGQDSRPFEAKIYNSEYQMYIKMNLYDKDIIVGQDESILGELPGYFWTKRDTRKWYIIDATLINDHQAELAFVNDFGSEDFTAILTFDEDGGYTLERQEGSKLKIVVNSKFVKIPKTVRFFKE